MSRTRVDVVILGGGLAGLTLALQLRARLPSLDVRVLERQRHPVPEAAHKVGESSVEIAGHYFDTVLGLSEHLTTRQLKKFGFRFFFSEGREDIDQVAELGASRYLATPSYQLDRGILENFLATHAEANGARFIDGAVVEEVSLARNGGVHQVRYRRDGETHEVQARWVVDASGRAGILKRQLDLAQPNAHDANAIWFRIGERIDVNDWSSDREWLARCDPPDRWRSTNHLVGAGYWAWLIPLSSGSHSVGIVCDAKLHPLRTMNTYERSMEWFRAHQPRLARALEGKEGLLQDFIALRRFSYGCRQVFSGSRWALTGEAGVFLDPFYSPGSDFIAIGNTYITDLIARDLAGEPVEHLARIYERFYLSFYESTLTLYVDQYPMFGNPEAMPVKVIWDYTYYWGVLCQLFFQQRLTDLAALGGVRREMTAAMHLNAAMQRLLRAWAEVSTPRNLPLMLDQARLDWFAELNRGLRDRLDDAAFRERLRTTTSQLRELAGAIAARIERQHRNVDTSEVRQLLGARGGSGARDAMLFEAA